MVNHIGCMNPSRFVYNLKSNIAFLWKQITKMFLVSCSFSNIISVDEHFLHLFCSYSFFIDLCVFHLLHLIIRWPIIAFSMYFSSSLHFHVFRNIFDVICMHAFMYFSAKMAQNYLAGTDQCSRATNILAGSCLFSIDLVPFVYGRTIWIQIQVAGMYALSLSILLSTMILF